MSLYGAIVMIGVCVGCYGGDPTPQPTDSYTIVERRVKITGRWRTVEKYKKTTKRTERKDYLKSL